MGGATQPEAQIMGLRSIMGIRERLAALDRRLLGSGRSRYDRGYVIVDPQLDKDVDDLRGRVADLERRLQAEPKSTAEIALIRGS